MQAPKLTEREDERNLALINTGLLDTPEEERFDRITRLAKRLFAVENALVTLVAGERVFFKSLQGLMAPSTESPRKVSFCGHAIHNRDIMQVPDALEDARFSDNPYVTGEPFIRFYAGAPLHSSDGFRLGTLCLIDSSPRVLTEDERATLRDLADLVEEEINRDQEAEVNQKVAERQKLAMLAKLVRETHSGLVQTNAEGLTVWANTAFTDMSGYESSTLLGQRPIERIKGEKTDAMMLSRLASNLQQQKKAQFELLSYRASGQPFWVHVQCSPMADEQGEFNGYLWAFTDLSGFLARENLAQTGQ